MNQIIYKRIFQNFIARVIAQSVKCSLSIREDVSSNSITHILPLEK